MRNEGLTRRQTLIRGAQVSGGLFALGPLLSACGGDDDDVAAVQGGSISWALAGDPVNLAPFGVPITLNHAGNEFMYDSLVQWNRNLEVQPALAESFSRPDPRTYEFKLRANAKFHDGRPVTAKDVVYSLELQADPPPPGDDSQLGNYPVPASVEAVDDRTVRVTYSKPEARLLGYLAWGKYSAIVPEGMYDDLDPRADGIGAGPFKLVDFRSNDRVEYERFKGYWDSDVPVVDRLVLPIMPDEQARVAALRSGEIDGCDVSPDIAKTLESDPSVKVIKGLTVEYRIMRMAIKRGESKPWHDVRVRQAINHAIDRRDIVDRAFSGDAEISGLIPPGFHDWPLPADELEGDLLRHDVDHARALMTEAGVDGFSAEMLVIAGYPDIVQSGQVIQQQLKEIGVNLKIRPMELGEFAATEAEGDFEMLITAKGMRGDPDGFFSDYDDASPQRETQFSGWDKDQRLQELLEEGRSLPEPEERKQTYNELERLLLQESVNLPLCTPYRFQAVSSNLSGMYVSYTGFNPGLRTAQPMASR